MIVSIFIFGNSKLKWYFVSWVFLFSYLFMIPYFFSSMGISKVYFNLFSDQISICLMLLSSWISFLMVSGSMKVLYNKKNSESFLLTIIFLNCLIVLMFLQKNLLYMYIFFESSLIPTLFLILGWGYQPERLQAGLYLVLYTVVGALPFLISLLLVYMTIGHLSLLQKIVFPSMNCLLANIWWFFLMFVFFIKLPVFSVHLWLPKAHVEAPVAGSMILAGLLLKLGGYGIVRLVSLFLLNSSQMSILMMVVCLVGGCISSLICIRQTDMKSLIAYSSIGHMGLMLGGLLTGTVWGFAGSLLLMIAHGLSSSGLFCFANMIYEKTGSRSIFISKGFLMIVPGMSLLFFLLCSVNMAAPPSINLLSEIGLITSILFSSFFFCFSVALLSFLSAAYSLFLYTATQHGKISSFISPFKNLSVIYYLVIIAHWIPTQIMVALANSMI